MLRSLMFFILTAIAEISGCYFPYLWLKQGKSIWLLVPGAICLGIFSWLLALQSASVAGRTYIIYCGVYVVMAFLWLWFIEGQRPDHWDVLGMIVILMGSGIIFFAPHKS